MLSLTSAWCQSSFLRRKLIKTMVILDSKRTVSEMQLMHNLGQHKQVEDRREWLLMRVRGIHNPAGRRGGGGDPAEARRRRRLRPEELDGLDGLTAEDIRDALDLLEHLLEPKQA
uniref:Parathyroid hormone n=1 Tax=Oryzias sinensis TaxID=183150 RepID=A0A8C7X3T9_9TELE